MLTLTADGGDAAPTTSSMSPAEKAIHRLKDLNRNREKLLVIHLSCEIGSASAVAGEARPRPPAIGHIVVFGADTRSTHTFGWPGESDKEKLSNFMAFASQQRDRYFMHWGMCKTNFGFEAIDRHYRYLGGDPCQIPHDRRIDLKELIRDIYGENFAPHPRLPSLIRLNNIASSDLLTAEDAALAFSSGQHERLIRSTARKVDALWDLFCLAASGRLRVDATEDGPCEPCHFYGNGEMVKLSPLHYACVYFLWHRHFRSARYGELLETVWKNSRSPSPRAIENAASRANKDLLNAGYQLECQNGSLVLTRINGGSR